MTLYCGGSDNGALLEHSDQYRGLKYSYIDKPDGPARPSMPSPARIISSMWT